MNRRTFIKSSALTAAAPGTLPRALADRQPPIRRLRSSIRVSRNTGSPCRKWSESRLACAGRKGPFGSAMGVTSFGALSRTTAVVASDVNRPNGLAFSPDESKLYVVEAGVSPHVIRAYDVVQNGTRLSGPRTFITAESNGTPDGLRVDVDGNLWCSWGMGCRGARRRGGFQLRGPRRRTRLPAARQLTEDGSPYPRTPIPA